MNSFSDVGSLNTQQFSRMSAMMTVGQRSMAGIGAAMTQVGGQSMADTAPGYNHLGTGHNLNLWA